ncbi:MAG: secondary thiamine-phosphate synthase enzyme YjbQ [Alphaproteobacteria bacterium]
MTVQAETEITIQTRGRGLFEFAHDVTAWVSEHARGTGLLTLFLRHTSASLLIQENADADVLRDLETFFAALVPDDPARYRHVTEGPDDMPAHIRAALTQTQLSIPVSGGALVLGTWQGIFLYEHRTAPHARKVALHLITG